MNTPVTTPCPNCGQQIATVQRRSATFSCPTRRRAEPAPRPGSDGQPPRRLLTEAELDFLADLVLLDMQLRT